MTEAKKKSSAARKAPSDIDAYIAGFPENVRAILQKIRVTIQKAAPQAEEAISYQIPTFRLNGNLIHFAAFKSHIGLYPVPGGMDDQVAKYQTGKGTLKFALDEPIPYDLIRAVVKMRIQESAAPTNEVATKRASKKVSAS
jgi:uncharacterized protein YdhG (YjbR/CyaY superfamily)